MQILLSTAASEPQVRNRRPRFKVTTVTGGEVELLHEREKKYYEEARDRYTTDFTFTVSSDLRSLDRLLLLEVQMHRAQWFLAAGMDYQLVDLDAREETDLRRTVKEAVTQIAEIQRDLGLTKKQRDAEQVDSIGAYLTKLRLAAKQHGVKREKELGKALELTHELFALCGAYQRGNADERKKLGFENGDMIVDWVMTYMQPEFQAVDDYFREHQQRFWVREM